MQDHGIRLAGTRQFPHEVLVRFAVVDHQRLAEGLGEFDVPVQRLDLRVLVRRALVLVQPVPVEAALPDRDDSPVSGQLGELGTHVVGEPLRFGRVHRDRCDDALVPLRGRDGLPGLLDTVADVAHHAHAGRHGAVHDRADLVQGPGAARP